MRKTVFFCFIVKLKKYITSMVTDLPVMTYSIYKLTFAPYMEGLIPGKLSKAKLKKLVSCVFDAINSDIHYETGSHKPV